MVRFTKKYSIRYLTDLYFELNVNNLLKKNPTNAPITKAIVVDKR
ncbi:MAG: hypothetical protein Q8N99_02630 [Nanoarchaeota archaeon]|nr:hypothetical protein [Nanoarchaeota archaeon]